MMDELLSDRKERQKDKLLSKILEVDRKYINHYKIVCPLCKKKDGRKKHKSYTNGIFLEGEYGYVYHCCKCMGEGKGNKWKEKACTLNQFLTLANLDAEAHAKARWEIGSTGRNFNCPNPPEVKLEQPDYVKRRIKNTGTADPKKASEIYKRQAQKRKEENYRKKYGSNYSS